MHKLIRYAALAGAIGLGACDLVVQNPNQPETDRVLASPADAEALIGSYYRRWHIAMHGTLSNVWGMTTVQSLENYSSLGNNCLNARAGIPRAGNDNSVANGCQTEQHRVYFVHGEVARVATNVLKKFSEPGYLVRSVQETNRAKAFAEFLRGLSHGYIALFYDSAAVISADMAGDDPGTLRGYAEVMDSALVALDNAIVHANAATGTVIPQSWIPTTGTLDMPGFIRLIRSYKARLRANVARTPAERAAVNWTEVINDAANGITADHDNITNSTTGPYNTWVAQLHTWGLWHQMPPFIIGMGDTSSNYATWIALPLDSRGASGPFTMITPDLRFPQGGDRAAQVADFSVTSCNASGVQCERYFVNRPASNDQVAGLGWGQSNYDFVRYNSWRVSGQNGSLPYMKKAEMDMLRAEGLIRQGGAANLVAAAGLINLTRTAGMVGGVATGGGLPPVIGTADGGLTMPTCVPRRPVNGRNSGGGTVACGDLFEAMKWEKRMETIQSHFGAWFLDSRGWGDLPEGTPYHWAPPYQDLQARRLPIYSTGSGSTGGAMAGPSTYGW